jgi:uncharacterized protein YjbI with pentapeptide repeats
MDTLKEYAAGRRDFSGAYLRGANLYGANLEGANLHGADLSSANLRYADLTSADLTSADLRGANLRYADLRGADLRGADLRGAILRGADLRGADLSGAKGLAAQCIVPEGAIVGYKRTSAGIVTLLVPRSARRCNAIGSRKCRAEVAVVLDARHTARDLHTGRLEYVTGATVRPDSYDPDVRVECSHGIHFFITREEAEQY